MKWRSTTEEKWKLTCWRWAPAELCHSLTVVGPVDWSCPAWWRRRRWFVDPSWPACVLSCFSTSSSFRRSSQAFEWALLRWFLMPCVPTTRPTLMKVFLLTIPSLHMTWVWSFCNLMSSKCFLTFDFGRLRIALFEHIFTTGIGLQSKKKNTVEKRSTFTFLKQTTTFANQNKAKKALGSLSIAVWRILCVNLVFSI